MQVQKCSAHGTEKSVLKRRDQEIYSLQRRRSARVVVPTLISKGSDAQATPQTCRTPENGTRQPYF